MAKKKIIYEKIGGRRIPLYAEVGKYFSPDGSFDENQFTYSIRELIGQLKKEHGDKKNYPKIASEWLSSYITKIIDYLNEKGMPEASFNLFKTAVEESKNLNISEISLKPDHLEYILTVKPAVSANKDTKKVSTDKKKARIFEAAIQIFAKEGYDKATIDKIASLSGVGKGSVYRYFNSKEDLLHQLLTEKYSGIVKQMSKILAKESNILKQIQEVIEFWVSFISENHVLYRLIQNEALMQRSGKSNMFFDYLVSHLPMIKERVVSLNQEKKLKTTSFYTVFYGIMGFIDGVFQKWIRCGMDYNLKDEIPIILEVLFKGFVGEKKSSGRFFIPPEEK